MTAVWDAGDGPPLVLGHSLAVDKRTLAVDWEGLAESNRTILWDAPGHGEAPRRAVEPWAHADLADDLATLLAEREVERAVVGGVGQGALVALHLALRHSALVEGLVLVSALAEVEPPEVAEPQLALVRRWADGDLDPELLQQQADGNFGPGDRAGRVWAGRWAAMDGADLLPAFEAFFARPDLTDRLGEVGVPALVIRGEADRWVSADQAAALADGLPDARLVTIAGAPHVPTVTHPGATMDALGDFLDDLDWAR